MSNPYVEAGYTSREEYLQGLADNMGLNIEIVYTLADVLGESEDFDGLVTELEDYIDLYGD